MIARLALVGLALAAAKDDPLAGRVAGAPVDCIDLAFHTGPTIVDAHTILYAQTRRRVWRTEPEGGCTPLHWYDTLIVQTQGRLLCRGDIFQTRSANSPIPSGACRMGRFTPYDLPAR